ncbi:MAG: hypothetical protein ORN26_01890 [Candidatus Pacebacteria bacterium]|nr:hypothetical protein [Candidatus Paceibacterota bacterium]
MPEKIKIGVDIDDVLFSFNQSFLDFYNEKHNTNYKMEDQHTYNYRIFLNSIDKETEITLFEEFYTSKYHDITLAIEDSIEYISHLKDFELISITARPVHTKDITEK